MTFHEELKSATDQAHREVETKQFISDLMKGNLSKNAYLEYLASLAGIYQALESELRSRSNSEILELFDHRALDRAQLINEDIQELSSELQISPKSQLNQSVQKYIDHIKNGNLSDLQLLAHHYLRYLGDLSGGQAIAKLVSRYYGLNDKQLSFYNFNALGDIVFYKKRYRNLLNLAHINLVQQEEFIDECILGYKLTSEIFIELGAAVNV